jgi:hypothetical protein
MTVATPQWLQTVQRKRSIRDDSISSFSVDYNAPTKVLDWHVQDLRSQELIGGSRRIPLRILLSILTAYRKAVLP